jgi:hypothetical protein
MRVINRHAAWALCLAAMGAAACTFDREGLEEAGAWADDEWTPEPPQPSSPVAPQQEPVAARQCEENVDLPLIRAGHPVTCSWQMKAGDELKSGDESQRLAALPSTLLFEGRASSGVTFDCNGGTVNHIRVRSIITQQIEINGTPSTVQGHPVAKKDSGGYYVSDRPENIVIKNCKVNGTVRVSGLGENGQGTFMWTSSRDTAFPGHTVRARAAAPTNITFDGLVITGQGGANTYYMGPGVTYTTLKNSEIKGSTTINVYFDAESAYNTLKHNSIHADTASREIVALDGSSFNSIVDNDFSALSNGGIYLYRNCGEGGTVRHKSPIDNQIINNRFYYNTYNGGNPSVWLGSRNARRFNHYCTEDNGAAIPWTSSTSDLDKAQYNVVMQNQIYKLPTGKMIREGEVGPLFDNGPLADKKGNEPNYIKYNTSVNTPVARKSGCYIGTGYTKDFLLHGETFDYRNSSGLCVRIACNDNVRTQGICAIPPTPPIDRAAEGFLEYASETGVSGWAADPDFSGPIAVVIYVDLVPVTVATANDDRPDLGAHGFSAALPKLSAGPHQIVAIAVGVNASGQLTNNNAQLAWSPVTVYAKDYIKYGNNGTVSCNTYCEGSTWGEVGLCSGAVRSDTGARITCWGVPGLMSSPNTLLCECQRGRIKPGNNGTVSCDTFCAGSQWGPVGACVGAVRSDTGQRTKCSTVPGLLTSSQLTCLCDP